MKKKSKPNQKPVVLYDDREHKPWLFLQSDYEMKRKRLKCGDYTIEGYEDIVAIEKKSGIEELLNDLTGKYRPTFVAIEKKSGIEELLNDLTGKYRPTFKRFLKKLSQYPVKCIIVEEAFTLDNICSAIRRIKKKSGNKMRLTVHTVLWWMAEITMSYGIPIIFIGSPMQNTIRVLLERALRKAQEVK